MQADKPKYFYFCLFIDETMYFDAILTPGAFLSLVFTGCLQAVRLLKVV